MNAVGTVVALRRYPVKSMLGEEIVAAEVSASGVHGDRTFALIDLETDRVASAKRPHVWRALLQCAAGWDGGALTIRLPDGGAVGARDRGVDRELSEALGRQVQLSNVRPENATLARPDPEDVLEHGTSVDVSYKLLEIGQGTSGATFVDYAPIHLITTSTLDHISVESVRYRPNLVVSTPSGTPFAENDWVGREITVGRVQLRGILPTPRCAIPAIEHGDLPRSPRAIRALLADNRVDVPGFGVLPCAGLYAEVIEAGVIRTGDNAVLH